METALLSVTSFATIIMLGIAASRLDLISKGADKLISTIVFKLTLPATIIHAFGSTEVLPPMLAIAVVGFACAAIPYVIALLVTRHMPQQDRPLFLFGAGGMNIGCFALPFIQAIFPASSVVTACLIDAGNSIVVTGGSFALTKALLGGEDDPHRLRTMLKRLFSSIPFDCYILLVALALAGIRIPGVVIEFVEPIANANPFLSALHARAHDEHARQRPQAQPLVRGARAARGHEPRALVRRLVLPARRQPHTLRNRHRHLGTHVCPRAPLYALVRWRPWSFRPRGNGQHCNRHHRDARDHHLLRRAVDTLKRRESERA